MLAELAALVRECDAGFDAFRFSRRRRASLRHHVAFVLRLVRRDHQAAPRRCRRPRVAPRRGVDGGHDAGRTPSPAASVHAVCDRGMRAAAPQRRAHAAAALVAGGGCRSGTTPRPPRRTTRSPKRSSWCSGSGRSVTATGCRAAPAIGSAWWCVPPTARGTSKHITRLIGGLVPAAVVDAPRARRRSGGRGFG